MVSTTACKWDSIIPLEPLWKQYKRVIKDKGAIVLTASEPFTSKLVMSNLSWFRYDMTWDKTRGSDFLNAKRKPLRSHEDILVFYKNKPTYNPQFWYSEPYKKTKNGTQSDNYGDRDSAYSESKDGKRYPLSIVSFKRDSSRKHPTQKPVKLFEYLIKTYTNKNEIVLDNVIGSGTTAVACLKTERKFIGFEKEEKYYNIALKRIGKCDKKYYKQLPEEEKPKQLQMF